MLRLSSFNDALYFTNSTTSKCRNASIQVCVPGHRQRARSARRAERRGPLTREVPSLQNQTTSSQSIWNILGAKVSKILNRKRKNWPPLPCVQLAKNLRDYPQKVNNGNDAIVGCIKGIAGTRAELVRDWFYVSDRQDTCNACLPSRSSAGRCGYSRTVLQQALRPQLFAWIPEGGTETDRHFQGSQAT